MSEEKPKKLTDEELRDWYKKDKVKIDRYVDSEETKKCYK